MDDRHNLDGVTATRGLFDDAEVIFAYTRENALDDGVLIDVSEPAREAGIKFPVAVTTAVWARYVEFDSRAVGQDENGRLWDILWMMRAAARASGGSEIHFGLHVAIPDGGNWRQSNERLPEPGCGLTRETHRHVTLKALCHPGDNLEPVITIMLPDED